MPRLDGGDKTLLSDIPELDFAAAALRASPWIAFREVRRSSFVKEVNAAKVRRQKLFPATTPGHRSDTVQNPMRLLRQDSALPLARAVEIHRHCGIVLRGLRR